MSSPSNAQKSENSPKKEIVGSPSANRSGHAQYSLPVPSPSRRSRCLSCSEQGSFMELNLEEGKDIPLPDIIVTRRTRSDSVSDKIIGEQEVGIVEYFCRSRGHGFVTPSQGIHKRLFMHISDIEGEFVPRKGDKVAYRLCPIPPRFEKFQAVHVHIVNYTPEVHKKWAMPETPEELEEDAKAVQSSPGGDV